MESRILCFAATQGEAACAPPTWNTYTHGAGVIASLAKTIVELTRTKPKLAVQIGIAGTLTDELQIGAVAQVVSETIYPYGIEQKDGSLVNLWDMDFYEDSVSPAGQIATELRLKGAPTVEGLTVVSGTGHLHTIQKIHSLFPSQSVESMEGYAFFYACKLLNIPCIQIRSISNIVEPRDKSGWNIPLALKNLRLFLASEQHSIEALVP